MSMLSDIIIALQKEMKAFFLSTGGTYLLDTELQDDITASFPLCILDVSDAPDSARLPGNGVTRMEWNFGLRIYSWEPGAYNPDDGGYSAGLLQIVDDLRNYMENEVWATQEMKDLLTDYGFRLTYMGTSKAEPLQMGEKLCLGYKHLFGTIVVEEATAHDTYPLDIDTVSVSGEIDFSLPGTDDIPIPDAPVAVTATNITSDSFTANWDAVSDAKGYFFDVASDEDFADLIIENIDLGIVLFKSVDGLDPLTDYFYRVRAYSDVRLSVNSNVIKVTTLEDES